jgi:hypothetical protein
MKTHSFLHVAVWLTIVGLPTAHAEFQLAAQGTAVVAGVPRAAEAPPPSSDQEGAPAKPVARHTVTPGIARGFGTRIPLTFAVKQVVPPSVRPSFAPDVDADAITVDWRGGRPWPDVLRDMLKAPNLRVTFGPGSVLIERWKPS